MTIFDLPIQFLKETTATGIFVHRRCSRSPPLFKFLAQLQIQPKMSKRQFEEEGYPLFSAPTTLTPPKSVRGTSQTTVQRAPPTTATGSESINNTELANMQLRRELIKLEYYDPVTNRRILKKEFEKFHCFMCKSTAISHSRLVDHVARCLSKGQEFEEMMLKSMEFTIQKNFEN